MSLSETLTQYDELKNSISELELPNLYSATLMVTTEIVNINELLSKISSFSATQGWVQYRDELIISAQVPTKPYILEAQYCNCDNNSLHIKLQQGESYLLSTFINGTYESDKTDNKKQFYTEQPLMLRNNLKGKAESANYRLWWQLESSGVNQGRWLPINQQFVGFNTVNNSGNNAVSSTAKEGK